MLANPLLPSDRFVGVSDMDGSFPQQEFPLLPLQEEPWSASILAAHEYIRNVYDHAANVLRSDGADPTHIAFHMDRISSDALPVLLELTSESERQGNVLPIDWLEGISTLLAEVVASLQFLGTSLKKQ